MNKLLAKTVGTGLAAATGAMFAFMVAFVALVQLGVLLTGVEFTQMGRGVTVVSGAFLALCVGVPVGLAAAATVWEEVE